MFTIELDGNVIYNPLSQNVESKLLKATLSLEDNNAGSLSLQLPAGNPGADNLELYTSMVTVKKDGVWFWSGRCITGKQVDFYNQTTVTFEGVLGILNDSIQISTKWEGIALSTFIDNMLTRHNARAISEDHKFYLRSCTVDDGNNDRYTEYESTLQCINDIITDNGGHLVLEKRPAGGFFIDYLASYNSVNSQYVNFGKNLLDFNRNYSMENYASVLLPLGKEDENGERITIRTVNQGEASYFNSLNTSKWGWIEKVAENSEIETPEGLLTWVNEEYSKLQENPLDLELEVSAIDLHVLDNNIQEINVLDQVRVLSAPHNVDQVMPVTKLELDLLNPAGNKYTIGTTVNVNLTSANSQFQEKVYKKLDSMPSETSILEQAKINATELINSATTGYVTVRPDAIYISNNEDYTRSTKLWTWNINGLGYSTDGGRTYGLAMTMDGAIVADYITTGTMSAARIRGGLLESENGNTSWNLNTGEFTMNSGSIGLGSTTSSNTYLSSGKRFNVTSSGLVTTSNDLRLVSTSSTSTNDIIIGRTPSTPMDLTPRGMRLNKAAIEFFYDSNTTPSSTYSGAACFWIEAIYPGRYNSNPNLYGIELRACNGYTNTLQRGGCINLDCDRLTIATETSGSGAYNYYVGGNGSITVNGTTLRFVHGIMVTDLS